jgi:hypothetical protein
VEDCVGTRDLNKQEQLRDLRSKEERKLKALYILLCLIVLAVISLLGVHAIVVGPGSLFWDFAVNFFAVFSVVALASGVIFPLLALLGVLALPFVLFALYLRNR